MDEATSPRTGLGQDQGLRHLQALATELRAHEEAMRCTLVELSRERDRALRRQQVLTAAIRAHEETMRRDASLPRRPVDDVLYRRLREIRRGTPREGRPRRRHEPIG